MGKRNRKISDPLADHQEWIRHALNPHADYGTWTLWKIRRLSRPLSRPAACYQIGLGLLAAAGIFANIATSTYEALGTLGSLALAAGVVTLLLAGVAVTLHLLRRDKGKG
jgi:hypothetical protein